MTAKGRARGASVVAMGAMLVCGLLLSAGGCKWVKRVNRARETIEGVGDTIDSVGDLISSLDRLGETTEPEETDDRPPADGAADHPAVDAKDRPARGPRRGGS